ncbi:MAG TPA: nuclear transport factor 2 family protein [Blastocatellia bacterium]|nr:nuclear transport factor 2 family protein [Blastocatellia bacterium]
MKKILIYAALLVVTSLPALAQNHQNDGAGQNALVDLLVARERAVYETLLKKDEKTLNNLVASDLVLVHSQGRRTRAELMKDMRDPDYSEDVPTIEDPQVTMIDQETAILTYRGTGRRTYKGESYIAKGYATSIWSRRDGEWKVIFHTANVVRQAAAPSK